MKSSCFLSVILLIFLAVFIAPSYAQTPFVGVVIVPSNPTSTNTITYVNTPTEGPCIRLSYRSIVMVSNNITITFSEWSGANTVGAPYPPLLNQPYGDWVELGKLPPGDYTLTTVGTQCIYERPLRAELNKFPFKVTDGRIKKSNTDPTIDFSGHWWDSADPGWGLFVWHDNNSNLMAAWFSYASDGKPAWFVFQPKWELRTRTRPADVWQTSKPPGAISPPPGTTKLTTVGNVSLNFLFGTDNTVPNSTNVELYMQFIYTLEGKDQPVRYLRRFKP